MAEVKAFLQALKEQQEQSAAALQAQQSLMKAMQEQNAKTAEQNAVMVKELQEKNAKTVEQLLERLEAAESGNAQSRRQGDGARAGPSVDALEKTIQVFEYEPEDGCTFNAWYEKYEDVFEKETGHLSEVQKVLMLIRKLSVKVDAQYRNSIAPKKVADFTLAETVERLTKLFGDYKTDFEKRLYLLNLRMNTSRINDFKVLSAEVNKAVEEAKMAELSNDQLKTMFFMASIDTPRHADTAFHLLSQLKKNAAVTMEELVQECDRIAILKNESSAVQAQGKGAMVHYVGKHQKDVNKRTKKVSETSSSSDDDAHTQKNSMFKEGKSCFRCGGRHAQENCRFKEEKCFACGKIGHMSKVCRSKKAQDSTSWKEHKKESTRMNRVVVNSVRNKSFDVEVVMGGAKVTMQVDTGADITLISKSTWEKIGKPKCKKADCKPVSACGQNLSLIGCFQTKIQYGDRSALGTVYVTKKPLELLGMDFIAKLEMIRLVRFRRNPNAQIGAKRPAESFQGRKRLNWSVPSGSTDEPVKRQFDQHQGTKARHFSVGDLVRYKTSGQAIGKKWSCGEILGKKGRGAYSVKLENGCVIKAYANQLVSNHRDVAAETVSTRLPLSLLLDTFSATTMPTAQHGENGRMPHDLNQSSDTDQNSNKSWNPASSASGPAESSNSSSVASSTQPQSSSTSQAAKQQTSPSTTSASSSQAVNPSVRTRPQRPQRQRQQPTRLNPDPTKQSY